MDAIDPSLLVFFAFTAVAVAAAAWWVLRAYRQGAPGPVSARGALAACAVCGVAAIGLYAFLGAPGRADAPHAARMAAVAAKQPAELTPEELIVLQEQAARERPADPMPYFVIGSVYEEFGELSRAAVAYDLALRRAGRAAADEARTDEERGILRWAQAVAMVRIARIRVAEQQGTVPETALRMFQAAAVLAPQDPEPWLYQAMAAAQAGRHEDAVRLWDETLSRTEEGNPIRMMATRMRERALRGEAPGAPPPMIPGAQ